jgi:hypothetical protein
MEETNTKVIKLTVNDKGYIISAVNDDDSPAKYDQAEIQAKRTMIGARIYTEKSAAGDGHQLDGGGYPVKESEIEILYKTLRRKNRDAKIYCKFSK